MYTCFVYLQVLGVICVVPRVRYPTLLSIDIMNVIAGCRYTASEFIGDDFTSGILAHRNEYLYFFLSKRRTRIKKTFYIKMTQEFLDGFLMRIKALVHFDQCTYWELVSQTLCQLEWCWSIA